MEGKEHNEDDDKLKSDSSENKDYFDSDSDEFGLPDVDDSSSESPFDSDYKTDSDYDDSEYTYREEDDYEDTAPQSDSYDARELDEEGGSNAGLIIFLILLVLILGGAAVWYFYFRTPDLPPPPPPKPKVEVVDTTHVEPEPIIVDDPSKTVPGEVTQLSSPTGRYYVIIASFIDDDLAMDYGKKLAKQGVGTSLLYPKSEKGFYRLAVADFTSLKEATLKSEELKSTYGNDVWVIRY